MNSVLIVEDDQTIRESLAFNLKSAGFAVNTAADGRKGLEIALSDTPDLVLLDIMLPEMDGWQVCEKLRNIDEDIRIVMMTALGTEPEKVRGLTIGADDYVTKPFSTEELVARVRAQLRRAKKKAAGKTDISFGDVNLDARTHLVKVKGKDVPLRPKEFQLLQTLAGHPGILFSRKRLGELVWGTDFIGSSRTIDVHVQRLREKVEKPSSYTFLKTVHGLGYRFDMPEGQ